MSTAFLSRLNRLKQTGRDQYRAECPAHGGHSLSVKITGDGAALLHCWHGCDTQSVLDAMGMSFSDLFPEKLDHHRLPQRSPWSPRDVLDLAIREATVVWIVAADLLEHRRIDHEDWARLAAATQRLGEMTARVNA